MGIFMKKMSKTGRIVTVAVVLIGTVLLGVLWAGNNAASMTKKTANQISSFYLSELSSATANHLQTSLDYHFDQVDSVARLITTETASDEKQLSSYIARMRETYGFSFLAFVDKDGYYHDGTGVYPAASNVSFLGRLMKGETEIVSYNEKIKNTDVILLGVTMTEMRAGDTKLMAVLAGINPQIMRSQMVLANENSHTYSSVITSDGTYVISSDVKGQFSGANMLSALEKNAEESSKAELKEIADGLKKRERGTYFLKADNGDAYYLHYSPLENTDWFLATLMPYEVIESTIRDLGSSINRSNMSIFAAFLIVLVFLFVLYMQINYSKQKQLEEAKSAAEQAFQIAEEANSAKSVFLSNMSHDIRTPMNAIIGFVTLLSRDADDVEKVNEYSKKIMLSSRHLLGLINDVLDMAKIESGKTTLNETPTDLAELVEDINTIIRPQMKAKHHKFDIVLNNFTHEFVYVDKVRVQQILLNLLTNAVKYTPEEGRITLEISEGQQKSPKCSEFSFKVTDNGYGIEPEYLEHIFDVFSREENSVVNKIQGTGLGLAITKNLVELMGGKIKVQSEKGKGSVFIVALDLMLAEADDDGEFWKSHNITRLLVVDDEESVCKNVAWTMEKSGVSVDYALNGDKAVELAQQAEKDNDQYPTILLDWQMPGKNGIETARELRRIVPHNVSILILTGYDYSEIEDEMLGGVVDGFIPKPFFENNLRHKIQEFLDKNELDAMPKKEKSSLEGKHILVAEDNELNSEILTALLETEGADCVVCENGKLALEEFEKSAENQYQLILMDVQMPVMNGYQATELIRESSHPQAKAIPIIAMTANAFAEDVQNALKSGMNAHLAKPIDMAALKKTVGELL